MSLLLSDGSFSGKTFWENEENGMLAVYNGNETETVTEVSVTVPRLRHLYGAGEATLAGGCISDWSLIGGNWDDTFFLPDETYAGGGALGIRTEGNAYAAQDIEPVSGGETYTLKARLKVKSGSAAVKTEFSQNRQWYQSGTLAFVGTKNGAWNEISYTFSVPDGADSVSILLRVIGGGEAYWDDVHLLRGDMEISVQNPGFENTVDGVLSLRLPAKTLMIFGPVHSMSRVAEKNNIVYDRPVPGAVIRCDPDTWVSQYIYRDGKKEILGFFVNGSTLYTEKGELAFFRWDAMLRPESR